MSMLIDWLVQMLGGAEAIKGTATEDIISMLPIIVTAIVMLVIVVIYSRWLYPRRL